MASCCVCRPPSARPSSHLAARQHCCPPCVPASALQWCSCPSCCCQASLLCYSRACWHPKCAHGAALRCLLLMSGDTLHLRRAVLPTIRPHGYHHPPPHTPQTHGACVDGASCALTASYASRAAPCPHQTAPLAPSVCELPACPRGARAAPPPPPLHAWLLALTAHRITHHEMLSQRQPLPPRRRPHMRRATPGLPASAAAARPTGGLPS